MENPKEHSVLIDIGTRFCKAGIFEYEKPSLIFPTRIGKKKDDLIDYYGEDIELSPSFEELIDPIENGTIKDFNSLCSVIRGIFQSLNIDPEDSEVILTEPSLNSINNRENLFAYMFEELKIENLFIANQALLSLCSTGKLTGIVLESGAGVTQIVPIFDAHIFPYGINRIDFGGNDLSDYLNRLLFETNNHFYKNKKYLKFLEQIKKEACYIEYNYKKKLDSVKPYQIKLPDGNSINIKTERITVPEAIFKQKFLGKDRDGIDVFFLDSINKCKETDQKKLYENIIVSGGNTNFPGFEAKLEKKIKKKIGKNKNVRFIEVEDKMNADWIGGRSFLAALKSDDFISRFEYIENGVDACIKKMDAIQA